MYSLVFISLLPRHSSSTANPSHRHLSRAAIASTIHRNDPTYRESFLPNKPAAAVSPSKRPKNFVSRASTSPPSHRHLHEHQRPPALRTLQVYGVCSPTRLKSPAHVLNSQKGTCFELSTLLVSLLIGNGHDVYVVSGFATKQCCENDQTYTECPANLEQEFTELFVKPEQPAMSLDDEDDLGISKFWKTMEHREKLVHDEEQERKSEQERKRIQKLEAIPEDHLYGNRIHSWVLLIDEDKVAHFIEPTTGIIHQQIHEQYVAIESIWNHENYWVNMKPTLSVKELFFDLNNLQLWEHLLVAEPWSVFSETLKFDHKPNVLALKHFTMPPSWVTELDISEEKFEKRFPHGHKVIRYRKTQHEMFNTFFTSNGTVCSIIKYEDYGCNNPIAEAKLFQDRVDKLEKLKIDLRSGRIIEQFDYDREDTMMRLEYFRNKKMYWNNSRIEFFHINRLDNLASLEADDTKIQINFINRLDHLLSYTVDFNPKTISENMKHIKDSVTKITEKFNKTNTSNDVDTRQYSSDQIFITYHFNTNEIFQRQRRYRKPSCLSCETKPVLQCGCKTNAKFKNKSHQNEYNRLLEAERTCTNSVWSIFNEVQDIQEIRQTERVSK